jgi:hypothetical protein
VRASRFLWRDRSLGKVYFVKIALIEEPLRLSGADICRQQPVSPPHDSPVILVSNSTEWTYLVVTATGVDTRPGEPM